MTEIVWTTIQLTITIIIIVLMMKKRLSSQSMARWGLVLLAVTMMFILIGNDNFSAISAQFAFILLALAYMKEVSTKSNKT